MAVLATCTGTPAQCDAIDLQSTRVALMPNQPGQQQVGPLRFRGGLVLQSSDPRFGGLSGLLVSPDGTAVLAVSDEAHWISFKLDYRDGDLVGAHDAGLGPMLDLSGQPLRGKEGDAESLAFLSSRGLHGDLAVGFEGKARIWRYAFWRFRDASKPTVVPTPPSLATVRRNKGLEALTRLPDGTLLALTEATLDESGNMIGWLLGAKDTMRLTFRRRDDFDVSDAAALPDGDVLVLERRFRLPEGVYIRLRRVLHSDLRANAVLDGTTLATMGPNYTIDNMEGLAVRRAADGATVLYMISDDNYNRFERTILLTFELRSPGTTQPRPR